MRQYIQLIGSTAAFPSGAADTAHHRMLRQPARTMPGQEGHEVFHHAHRAHARAAAAVRDAEGLVQVQVAHVAAELARRGHAHQRVHVGAVHVDAAAVLVHDRAQLLHLHLEHAVRARVGDHDAGEVGAVLLALRPQVAEVHVAVLIARGHHHLHAGHLRAGRIGAVRRGRDQADVAMRLAAARVPRLDRQQARVFTLRAGIRLQADAGIAGGLAQPRAQLLSSSA
jgi:hypothetical protein